MPAVEITCYEVRCNHCDRPFDNGDRVTMHFTTRAEGLAQAVDVDDWIVTRDGGAYCPNGTCQVASPDCQCDDDVICSAEACPTGCPCPLHPEVPPVPACRHCGATFENHAQAWLHTGKHPRPTTSAYQTTDTGETHP